MQRLSILHVEDQLLDRKQIERMVTSLPDRFHLVAVNSVAAALEILEVQRFDAVLADYDLGDGTGFEIIKKVKDAPVIFITGGGDEATAVEAIQEGAYDYITKDIEGNYVQTVPIKIERSVRRFQADRALRLIQYDRALNGIGTITSDGRMLGANESLARMLIDEPVLPENFNLFECLRQRDQQRLVSSLADDVYLLHEEITLNRPDGSELHALISANRHEHETDKQDVIEFSINDVTARHVAEQKQQQLESKLYHAQNMEALATLASGVAHDFKNLLSVIIGYSNLANIKAEDPGAVRDLTVDIQKAGHQANKLIEQVFSFSRREPRREQRLSLTKSIRDVATLIEGTLMRKGSLTLDLETGRDEILADSVQVQQILVNLSGNAMDALPDRGGVITVSLREVEDSATLSHPAHPEFAGPGLNLRVQDNGCGIDAETLEKIFEPFFTTKGDKGTGLGLAVVQGIVQSAGGNMQASSTLGSGTIFSIMLPHAADREKQLETSPE